jgi:hypothetical protein
MNRSVVPTLLFDLLAISKGEVTCYEKLFIILNTMHLWEVHERYLADLYVECGCYAEAIKLFQKLGSHRKMGDLAWVAGDFKSAKQYYITQTKEHRPDWDRLFRLAMEGREWREIVELFFAMEASPIPIDNQFVLGSSAVPVAPIRSIVLLALIELGRPLDGETTARFRETMGIEDEEVQKNYAALASYSEADVIALQKKSRPRILGRSPMTANDATERGRTPRAQDLRDYLIHADSTLSEAKASLIQYFTYGNDNDLECFITHIAGSGIGAITESMRFEAMNLQWPARLDDYPDERVIRLLSSHPSMNKSHFGQLLGLKLKNGLLPSGEDLVTGMFQMLSTSADQFTRAEPLDYQRLSSAREWAIQKCQDWADGLGLRKLQDFRLNWLSGFCKGAKTLYRTGKEKPEEPRDTQEWHEVLKDCQRWLSEEWKRELEDSQWKAETQIYLSVKKTFKNYTVIRHASPGWLAPQHYDIFIPELELAIEYMGQQHYEPIDFFGGQFGFENTRDRDVKKARISKACGVTIHYVKYDDDMTEAMKNIRNSR